VVKIWSRSGMLRSTLATVDSSVYSLAWSPDSNQLCFTCGKDIIIKPLQVTTPTLRNPLSSPQAFDPCMHPSMTETSTFNIQYSTYMMPNHSAPRPRPHPSAPTTKQPSAPGKAACVARARKRCSQGRLEPRQWPDCFWRRGQALQGICKSIRTSLTNQRRGAQMLMLKKKINGGIHSFVEATCSDSLESQVWDAFGRVLFQSKPLEFAITACSWSPNGELFAIGMYDCVRLCDRTGWSYSRDQVRAAKTRRRASSSREDVETCASARNQVLFLDPALDHGRGLRLNEAEDRSSSTLVVVERAGTDADVRRSQLAASPRWLGRQTALSWLARAQTDPSSSDR
jgi:WD40 repeat protein